MNRSLLHALNWVGIISALSVMVFAASMGRADALDDIGREARSRIAYQKMGWAGDFYAEKGRTTPGNCLTYARTVKSDAAKSGIDGKIRHCVLWNDVEHAYFKADDGRVLDIKLIGVVTEQEIGCVRWRSDID